MRVIDSHQASYMVVLATHKRRKILTQTVMALVWLTSRLVGSTESQKKLS